MKWRFPVWIPILVAILAIGWGDVLAKKDEVSKTPSDFSGWWTLDASKSDTPAMGGPGGFRGRGEGGGGGGWGGRRRGGMGGGARPEGDEGGGPPGGRGGRPARLPERIHVRQDLGSVSIADSIGAPVEEIVIGRKVEQPPEGMEDEKQAPRFEGAWNKGALEIERKGRRGTVKETIKLEEDGRELVFRTSIPARDSRPGMEFKRVYRRTST